MNRCIRKEKYKLSVEISVWMKHLQGKICLVVNFLDKKRSPIKYVFVGRLVEVAAVVRKGGLLT